MKYSIIITYYKGFNILKSMLKLLCESIGDRKDIEIIVVNDNPETEIFDVTTIDKNNRIMVIQSSRNGGYSVACNLGVEKSSGEYIILMDCDIFVTPNWLNGLEKVLTEKSNIGCVSSTILNLNDSYVVHWGMAVLETDIIKPFRNWKLPISHIPRIEEFPLVTSGCMLVSSELYNKVNGMDEKFLNGYCDLDFVLKCRELGYKIYATSDSIVYHRGKVAGHVRLLGEGDPKVLFYSKWSSSPSFPTDGQAWFKYLLNKSSIAFSNTYIYFNFSHSLVYRTYYQIIKEITNVNIERFIDLKHVPLPCLMEDVLPWDYCSLPTSFIYFVDDINYISHNYHWFFHRKGKSDLIVDRNGNIELTDSLINDISII